MRENNKKVLIKPFEHHVHLTEVAAKELFGDSGITFRAQIGNTREFEANERVSLRGPNGCLEDLLVIGPYKPFCQAELMLSDCKVLGITAHYAENLSGDGEQLAIIGPKGELSLPCGMVCQRHIHLGCDLAKIWGITKTDMVQVEAGDIRQVIFKNVLISRGSEGDAVMHIDLEESAAAGITDDTIGYII